MDAETIAKALGGKRNGSGWILHCPAHNDQNPSLSMDDKEGKILFYCQTGCSQDEVIGALKAKGLWTTRQGVGGAVYPQTTVQPCNLQNYAAKKRFPVEFLQGLGLSDFTYQNNSAIKIPYQTMCQ